jgi:glycosyltransferase involved in cell wall biosynthesis
MPAVSVLLPCFNVTETLSEALDSIRQQTLTDIEIIAVDDGSTDTTGELLQEASREDSRLTIISQPHAGIIPALNAGLAACRTPYIARMDADDRAHPARLEHQKSWLDQHPRVALVSCLVEAFPPRQVREGFRIYLDWLNALITHEDICREIFIESPFPHPSVMFRKEWVENVGGYQDHGWPEDYDLWLRLYLAGAEFAKVPATLLAWRERPDRLTRTDSRYSVENFIRARAYYLARGPLVSRDAVILWGAGMMGRRLSKHLIREGAPLVVFVDIDPKKIGNTRRGKPIIAPDNLPEWWARYQNPILLAGVGARGARELIREQLSLMGFIEGKDWLGAA